jgi:mono/diheme cytochrome c family protein
MASIIRHLHEIIVSFVKHIFSGIWPILRIYSSVMRVINLFIFLICPTAAAVALSGCGGSMTASNAPRGPADPVHGQQLFQQNCSTCHGGLAQGMPHGGANLRKSRFVSTSSDERLIQFVKTGRLASDPENHSGVQMPPLGGNRALDEPSLLDIIAHLRHVQQEAKLDPPDEDEAQEASAKL